MRRSGTLINWNDGKGFGFIVPRDGGDDVFLHFRAIVDRTRRPKTGDHLDYDLDYDAQQRPRAVRALIRASPLPSGRDTPHSRKTSSTSRARTSPSGFDLVGILLVLLLPATVLGALW